MSMPSENIRSLMDKLSMIESVDYLDEVVADMPSEAPAHYAQANFQTQAPEAPQAKVGGWYNIMMNRWNPDQLSKLVYNIQDGNVKSIIVKYDENDKVAKQVVEYLKTFTRNVEAEHTPQEDTALTQYAHDLVTIEVHTR